jgi:hypothetical protein
MEKSAKKVLTKYFYKDNQLCFQILITLNDKKDIMGEYSNYSDYRRAFNDLLARVEAGNIVNMNTYEVQQELGQVA